VEREVVLAIDDWQWLDPPTRHAVSFAMRRVVDEWVRLVVAVRSGGGVAPAELGAAPDRIAHVRLGALSVASLHGILAERLETTFSRPTLVRIERAAAGNPFYALEIARVLAAGGTGSFAVSDDLRALVADRVRALPAETRDALLRVAAMARPELRLVDAEALVPAEEAGILRIDDDQRIHFAHPLFASGCTPPRRRSSAEAHRELAQVVADPEGAGAHLALAADGPDEVAAGAASARLGSRERGAPDAAAELAALALKLTADGARRSRSGASARRASVLRRRVQPCGRRARVGADVASSDLQGAGFSCSRTSSTGGRERPRRSRSPGGAARRLRSAPPRALSRAACDVGGHDRRATLGRRGASRARAARKATST
jgi:hypothetical protein